MCKDCTLGLAHSRHDINVDTAIDGCHFKQAEKNTGTEWMSLDLMRCLKEVFVIGFVLS